MDERRKFRDEITNKIETKLDGEGKYYSVIFKDEEAKFNFAVTPEDRGRLKAYMKTYFACADEALLEKMLDEANRGRYIVFKEYSDDGVNLKVIFLSPQAKYWDWLIDINGIENLFHVYNFSVGVPSPQPNSMYAVIQTEGAFFGVTQAVTLPVAFNWDYAKRTMWFQMPQKGELGKALAQMPPVRPGRDQPLDKLIDLSRTHPFFLQLDEGEYMVTDDEIKKYYEAAVVDLEKCPVKESSGHWTIQEDYPYLVVDYSLKTRVNVNALLPPSMRFMAGAVENVAQVISDEVSVKYLPLSMRNFRDFTQQWTKTGGPK
jgi:hypothetical protein